MNINILSRSAVQTEINAEVPPAVAIAEGRIEYFKTAEIPQTSTLLDRITSQFYNQTILRGAAKPWDRERIQNGKLAQYKAIGAKEVEIQTEQGGVVHGCYFDTKMFMSSIAKMGGSPVQLSVSRDLPQLQLAQPVNLMIGEESCPGVRIPSRPGYEHLLRDVSALQQFCKSKNFVLLNEDFTPVTPSSGLVSYFKQL